VPVLDLLRAGCGIHDADDPDRIGAKVRATLDTLGLDANEREPYLLNLLGVKDPEDRLAALGAETIMTRTFEALRQMTLLAGRRRPLVLLVEDLHWIDQTSESYLASLVESLARARILLLATYRPGYRPAWMDRSYATQLSLRPLPPADSLAVVRSLLPDVVDADPRARLILDKAEGNPFFLEELARVVGDGSPTASRCRTPSTASSWPGSTGCRRRRSGCSRPRRSSGGSSRPACSRRSSGRRAR
jgi:predicted ATPase